MSVDKGKLGQAVDSPLFLALWIETLCLAARDPDVDSARGLTDVVLVVAAQLAGKLGRREAYSADALIEAVAEVAVAGGCVAQVDWAVGEALRRADIRAARGRLDG